MARDPHDDYYHDDYYHDDPDRDERERGSGDDRRSDRARRAIEAARGRVAAPALFLIFNGLFGLVCIGLLSVPMIFQPEMLVKFGRDMAAQQPPGQQRQDIERQMDDTENLIKQNRAAFQIENVIKLGILAIGNLFAIVGGLYMRTLSSYGLSMTGAIVSLLPGLTGCCFTGTLFGLWALIALLNPAVKAGFAARRGPAYPPDRY